MTEPEPKIDVILPADSRRGATEIYLKATAVGLWTGLLSGYALWSRTAQVSFKLRWLAFVFWPVLWLIAMIVFTQIFMGLAQLIAKLFRLKEKTVRKVAGALIVLGFSSISIWLLTQPETFAKFLGGSWFVGLVLLYRHRKGD